MCRFSWLQPLPAQLTWLQVFMIVRPRTPSLLALLVWSHMRSSLNWQMKIVSIKLAALNTVAMASIYTISATPMKAELISKVQIGHSWKAQLILQHNKYMINILSHIFWVQSPHSHFCGLQHLVPLNHNSCKKTLLITGYNMTGNFKT